MSTLKKEKPLFSKEYKKITFDDMVDYIEQYYSTDKSWFKELSDNNNFLTLKRLFCEKYNPTLIPVTKPKAKKRDRIANW